MTVNKIFISGNLTNDPELKQTGHGNVCFFNIASNRQYTTNNGEKREDTCYIGVTVWGKQGESCARYLAKGRGVLIEGRLDYRTWTTENGDKRNRHEICAERVQFLGGARNDDDEQQ